MASKELIEKVAQSINNVERKWMAPTPQHYKYAEAAIATILAALQEPTGEMLEMCDREDAMKSSYVTYSDYWRAMLNASALGEQSE